MRDVGSKIILSKPNFVLFAISPHPSTNEDCIWAIPEPLYISHHALILENKTNKSNVLVDIFFYVP